MQNPAASAFQRHYAQIVRYLRRRTRSDEDAEDLAQAVFADAAARLEALSPAAPPPLAWLYTVARRRLADAARDARRAPVTIASLDDVRAAAVAETAYPPSVARAIRDALEALPAGQRQVVVMKLLEGRSFAEIAAAAGATEAACKMRFARGLEAVRVELASRGIEP